MTSSVDKEQIKTKMMMQSMFNRVDLKRPTGIGAGQIKEAIIDEKTLFPDCLDEKMDGEEFLI